MSPKLKFSRDTTPKRNKKKVMLIVCEGEKTEPNYFNGYKKEISHKIILDIRTSNKKFPKHIVNTTKQIASKNNFDYIWCVFDKDNDFNDACNLARSFGFRVAFSNESFELWVLLHFEYLHVSIGRGVYEEKLNNIFRKEFKRMIKIYIIC